MNDSNWRGLRDKILSDPYDGCHWCRERAERSRGSKRDSFPINEENLQLAVDAVAAVGPFVEQRAVELGQALGREFAKMQEVARGVEWTVKS